MNREKLIDYIDFLIQQSNQSDKYFQERNDLFIENQQLKEKNKYLKEKIENKDKWCQLIADIGFDYDGYNDVEHLKSLIDELVKYALYSRDNYDYEDFLKEGNEDETNNI